MNDWVAALADFIVANRAWAAPVFGLVAFGESLAVAGTLIPATPILFLMGTLVGSGKLDALPVLGWAMFGAIAGYWVSWAVGRRVGSSIYRHHLLIAQRRGIARTRLFFRRWGGPALIVGRYVLGPFQSMLPLVAGVAAMDPRRFHLWSTISGVTWVIVCLAPGYLTAKGMWAIGLDEATERRLIVGLTALSLFLVIAGVGAAVWRGVRYRRRA